MLQPPTMKVSAESADQIENRAFEEISVGDSASLTRTLSRDDIALFAVMSGAPVRCSQHEARPMKQLIRLLNRLIPAQRPLRSGLQRKLNAQHRYWGYPGWHL